METGEVEWFILYYYMFSKFFSQLEETKQQKIISKNRKSLNLVQPSSSYTLLSRAQWYSPWVTTNFKLLIWKKQHDISCRNTQVTWRAVKICWYSQSNYSRTVRLLLWLCFSKSHLTLDLVRPDSPTSSSITRYQHA